MVVVFLISIGGWYNEHKDKIKFWLGKNLHRKLVGLVNVTFFLLDGIIWF